MESGAGRSQKCTQRGQLHILPLRFLSNIVLLIVSLFLHVSLPDVPHQRWMNFCGVTTQKRYSKRKHQKRILNESKALWGKRLTYDKELSERIQTHLA